MPRACIARETVPPAAITVTPLSMAYPTATLMMSLEYSEPRDRLMTFAPWSVASTIPDAMVDMAAIDIEDMTGMTTDDLNTVIATERVPFFLIQRADAPWGETLDEFVTYAQANPGEVRHITGGPGGGMDAAMRFWLGNLGITVTDVIGGNPTERALAVASPAALRCCRPRWESSRYVRALHAGGQCVSVPVPSHQSRRRRAGRTCCDDVCACNEKGGR